MKTKPMPLTKRTRYRPDGSLVRQVTLEIPLDLYESVAARAKQNTRSLSAEIVTMLREVR